MLNEEIHAQYQELDDLEAVSHSQVDGSSNADGQEYGEEEGDQEIELTKIKRENVFSQIDFTKRKTKIVCTLG